MLELQRKNTGKTVSTSAVRWIVAAWLTVVAFVVIASLIPAAAPPGVWGLDKVVHFGVFLVLMAVPASVLSRNRTMLGTIIFLFAVGLGIEVAQSFIPGRVGSGSDFLADVLGVLAGAVVGRQVWRRLYLAMWTENAAPDPQGSGK